MERTKNFFPISSLERSPRFEALFQNLHFEGTEVFISSVVPREKSLFTSGCEKQKLIDELKNCQVKRVHLSYWAEPCDFLDRKDFKSLLKRFSSEAEISSYYSDLTGEHIYRRWAQEYEIAKDIGAEAVTFHAIDYFHIDGLWRIEKTKKEVLDSFANISNKLLSNLTEKGLLENGPVLEIENAGFGLETGVQTAEDYISLLSKIKNKDNIKIGWDTNHLLHVAGYDPEKGIAYFLLDDKDKTELMKELEEKYFSDPDMFFQEWIERNLLNKTILPLLGSIHLSDLKPLAKPIFLNGPLISKYFEEINKLNNPVEQENYGARLVLKYYDSHLSIENSPTNFPKVMNLVIDATSNNISLLHELKNSNLNFKDYERQMKKLRAGD